jgi:holliday junction DNA helicase RuvA
MIAYLEGSLLKKDKDRIILLTSQVGYEILVPFFVMETLQKKAIGDPIALYIYYHQTERQPKPVLIGFNLEVEREFFQQFISVEDIGPIKAAKALIFSVREIARAIETKNTGMLKRLSGIGERTAHKIVATLQGKMGKFALIRENETEAHKPAEDFITTVLDVLVEQLGHRMNDARQLIEAALKRKPNISNPEDLFEEVYRGEILNE